VSSPTVQLPVILVGPGRASRAFARTLLAAGGRIRAVVGRDRRSADLAAAQIGAQDAFGLGEDLPDCGILLLGVPDDALAPTAQRLAGRVSCPLAYHLSGALPAEEIAPLRGAGASIGSLHPLRPFTGAPSEDWTAALVAVEGDEAAVEAGEALARQLGARPYRLASLAKPLYHAAATLAAGGTVALLSVAVRACVRAGLTEDAAREALSELSSRAAAAAGERAFREAFTGPVERRDLRTIRAHLQALAAMPEALLLYETLALETLERTSGRGGQEEIFAILGAKKERTG
jgi:predicted short-subunit dehydrogenase-like oxidoreductase (DUF2520 family)